MDNPSAPWIRFGDFELDVRAGELRRGRTQIRLQEQPFQILLMLLEKPGAVVTREEVRQRLWPDDTIVEFDHSIGTAIKKLRQALGDDAGSPRYVETLPKRGFRFVFPEVLRSEPAEGTPSSPAQPMAPAVPRGHRQLVLAVSALILVCCVCGWLVWRDLLRPKQSPELDEASLTQVTASASLDLDPSLSPDGSAVAYSSNKNGNFEIYVKSLAAGGQEIQLTHDAEDNFEPAWSPDGKSIAYYSRRRSGIWVMPALGGAARRLTDFGSWPAWSPDSAKIVFQSQGLNDFDQQSFAAMPPSTLWIVSAHGGAPTQITQPGNPTGGHGAPTWSPDGKHIAFSSTSTSFGEIWSVPAAGGEPRRLVKNGSYAPVYGPHGKYLYYSQGWTPSFKLMRIPVTPGGAAGKPELVKETGSVRYKGLRFSANGRLLAFSAISANNNLQSIRVSPSTGEAIGDPVALTRDTAVRKTSPRFSPDDSRIAYTEVQTGEDIGVWVVDPDGKNAHSTGAMSTNGMLPGWLPGGQFTFQSEQSGQKVIEAIDLNTGTTTVLREFGQNDAPLRLSPDGKQVAYGERRGEAVNVWVAPIGGGPAKQLTFSKGLMSYPIWSPDGKTIAFEHGPEIALVPSSGGPITVLTADHQANYVGDWSRDGDKIVFAGLRNGVWNIYWVSRRTREEKQLTHYTSENEYVRYPAWSPRGDQIVYEYAETTGNIWTMRLK